MKKQILTGSEGFIGSHLKKLLNEEETIFMDRRSSFNPVDINGLIDQEEKVFYEGSLICEDRFKIELIYHLAGQTDVQKSIKAPMKDAVDNILTMIKMVTLFPNAKIVYTQTGAITYENGNPVMKSPYAMSKYMAEQYLCFLGNDFSIVTLPNVYGEGGRGVVDIFKQSEKIKITGDGSQTRNFIYVGDVARQLVESSKSDSRVNFLEGEYLSIRELADLTEKYYEFIGRPEGEVDKVDKPMFVSAEIKNDYVKVVDYLKDKHKKTI